MLHKKIHEFLFYGKSRKDFKKTEKRSLNLFVNINIFGFLGVYECIVCALQCRLFDAVMCAFVWMMGEHCSWVLYTIRRMLEREYRWNLYLFTNDETRLVAKCLNRVSTDHYCHYRLICGLFS